MAGIEDLYREIILDHYRNPRNRGELPPPAHKVEGFNPLCGDEVTLYIDIDNDTIHDVKIGGQGCSISQSSASMMTAAVKGKSVDEAREVFREFKALMSLHEKRLDNDDAPPPPPTADELKKLGDLQALQGVVKFPVRIKCATLSWNALSQALDETSDSSGASN